MKSIFLACTLLLTSSVSAFCQSQHHTDYLESLLDADLPFDTTRIVASTTDNIENGMENAWRNWATVENYKYGKDRGSLPMIADIQSLHPYFRDKVIELIEVCREQGIELAVVESFRTHAKQQEYFGMGRKYTRSKGGKSKHQYGLAVDLVPIVDSVAVWDNITLWKKIGIAGEKLGLRWGGRWRAPYDPAHFEWLGGVNTYQLANGYQPAIPRLKAGNYPCIDEELTALKRSWQAWEVEQAVWAKDVSKPVKVVSR